MAERTLDKEIKSKYESLRIKTKKIEEVDFCVVFFVSGFIDPQNIQEFQQEIETALASGFINFIFDFEELNYISSNSLGIFTDLRNNVNPYGGDIVFYGLQGKVLEVFTVLGFYDYFTVSTDIYEAIDLILYKDDAKEGLEPAIFPMVFNCPICKSKLKANKSGFFRCSSCKTLLDVKPEGKVVLG